MGVPLADQVVIHMKSQGHVRSYIIVTAAYWAFTLTDGALRMLVLGHFHKLGYSPFALASLFVLYEFCGMATNFVGGWMGSRTGLKLTLILGLSLQIAALCVLAGLSSSWGQTLQVAYVIAAQGISGVAKDFTKLSAKSALKGLVPANDSEGTLFRWVALLTGSKNTLKGIGFFLGGFLLSTIGFRYALIGMAATLLAGAIAVAITLPPAIGKAISKFRLSDAWRGNRAIKILSTARLFLFCARDVWFVVALPVFLSEVFAWNFLRVGTYLALWVIGYGLVQAMTPRLMRNWGRSGSDDARAAQLWGGVLSLVPLAIYLMLKLEISSQVAVLGGLGVFGVVFAINSALHSYLVLAYSENDKVALNVGFYYTANAAGRLGGTLLSGLLYQLGGLGACLLTASLMVAVASLLSLALPDTRALWNPDVTNA